MERYSDMWRDEPREEQLPVCPECGSELGMRDRVYTCELGDTVVGCSRCLHSHAALERMERPGEDVWMAANWE